MAEINIDINLSADDVSDLDILEDALDEWIDTGSAYLCDRLGDAVRETAIASAPVDPGVGIIKKDMIDFEGETFFTKVYPTGNQAYYLEYGAGQPALSDGYPGPRDGTYMQHPENFHPEPGGDPSVLGWYYGGQWQRGWPSYHFMWDGYVEGEKQVERIAREVFR